jgi:hypothetical protein
MQSDEADVFIAVLVKALSGHRKCPQIFVSVIGVTEVTG